MVFWLRCPKQGLQFDLPLSQTGEKPVLNRVWYYEPRDLTQTLSSLFLFLACRTRSLREVETTCDRAADKRRVSFPYLHIVSIKVTVNRTLQCHQSTSDHFLHKNAIIVGVM